jgi:hypothetical protein
MPRDHAAYGLVHAPLGIVGAHAEGFVPPSVTAAASVEGGGELESSPPTGLLDASGDPGAGDVPSS